MIDGSLSHLIELEPTTAITSLTTWTSADPAEVVAEDTYDVVSRDPRGTVIAPSPGYDWPAPERRYRKFRADLRWRAGKSQTPRTSVPASVKLMVERAIEFRAGRCAGLGDIRISTLEMDKADSYQTDQLPRELTDIARAFFYRPGLFVGRAVNIAASFALGSPTFAVVLGKRVRAGPQGARPHRPDRHRLKRRLLAGGVTARSRVAAEAPARA